MASNLSNNGSGLRILKFSLLLFKSYCNGDQMRSGGLQAHQSIHTRRPDSSAADLPIHSLFLHVLLAAL